MLSILEHLNNEIETIKAEQQSEVQFLRINHL